MAEIADKGQARQGEPTGNQRYLERLTFLKAERSSWVYHWQEISDFIFPRRFRYLQTDRNKGTKRNDRIINNKPTIAIRILAAGKMAGLTSPARPWGRFTLSDPNLSDLPNVKEWLTLAEKLFFETMAKSNLYNCLHEVYGVQAAFSTAALYIEEDDEDDVRGYVFPIGQFCLATNAKQRVDTIYREFSMTVGQLVEEFGLKACTQAVQLLYKERKYDAWQDVLHVIEPNRDRGTQYADSRNMRFKSIWIEKSASVVGSAPLRVSGYEEFPVMVARWYVTGEDAYGSGSPGMDCLGDCKALQLLERRKAQVVDKLVDPTMAIPASMKTQRVSMLPGDKIYVPDGQVGQVKPAMEMRPESLTAVKEAIGDHERRISTGFYTDLFVMMLEDDRQQPSTAREINERHEEKMLQLGPVVERDEDELLDPLINRVMGILFRRGRLPPPPPELQGQRVKVEYISVMAQAQKMLGTASIERLASFAGSTSAVQQQLLDNINWDALIIEYAKMLGVPPSVINPDEVVQKIREQRQQQQQAQQQAQMMQAGAQAAESASKAELDKNSMLDRLLAGTGATPLGSA